VVYATILFSTRDYRTGTLSQVPERRVAVVFGAHVYANRIPSPILRDRLDGAIDLYKAGKVKKVLVSGDNRQVDYNEAKVMGEYALANGVDSADLAYDYGGRSTYDTCYRAKHIFGVENAVLLTQKYHAPRAVYLCRQFGINAHAFTQPDFERYPDLRVSYLTRELFADLKAWWQVHVTRPPAEVTGRPEPAL
jgi:vancomycin permeability regulator SanA